MTCDRCPYTLPCYSDTWQGTLLYHNPWRCRICGRAFVRTMTWVEGRHVTVHYDVFQCARVRATTWYHGHCMSCMPFQNINNVVYHDLEKEAHGTRNM
jgi:hypothetical protein